MPQPSEHKQPESGQSPDLDARVEQVKARDEAINNITIYKHHSQFAIKIKPT